MGDRVVVGVLFLIRSTSIFLYLSILSFLYPIQESGKVYKQKREKWMLLYQNTSFSADIYLLKAYI